MWGSASWWIIVQVLGWQPGRQPSFIALAADRYYSAATSPMPCREREHFISG
jgi:hypothetical protein